MKKTIITACVVSIIAVSITAGCSGTSVMNTGTHDLYMTGNIGEEAVYWKNGVPTKLTLGGRHAAGHAIVVVNGDVYVGGTESSRAVVWKNGKPLILSSGVGAGIVRSLYVTEKGIFAAGSDKRGNNNRGMLWQFDTQLTPISVQSSVLGAMDAYSEAVGVCVVGETIHVAGSIFENGYSRAVDWINGKMTRLPFKGDESGVTAMCSDGHDVYIGGFIKNTDILQGAAFWKNGSECALLSEGTIVTGMWITTDRVFITGSGPKIDEYYRENGREWINGKLCKEFDDSSFIPCSGVTLKDISYVVGHDDGGGVYYDASGIHHIDGGNIFAITAP